MKALARSQTDRPDHLTKLDASTPETAIHRLWRYRGARAFISYDEAGNGAEIGAKKSIDMVDQWV